MVPNGLDEIVKMYGDPRSFIKPDGSFYADAWSLALGLVKIEFPSPLIIPWGNPGTTVSVVRCHPAIADDLTAVLDELDTEGLFSQLKTFGGCFEPRRQRNSRTQWSCHTWAIALDFDVVDEPFGHAATMDPDIVAIFAAHNFEWGGTWPMPRTDGEHFQRATGY